MNDTFNNLILNKRNNAEVLVQWMKCADIFKGAQKVEENVMAMFDDVQNKSNVTFDKFIKIIKKIAAQTDSSLDEIVTKLEQQSEKIRSRVDAASDKLFNMI